TPIQPVPREPEDRVQIRAVRPRSATATTEPPTGKDSFPPVQARPEPEADVRETKKIGDDRVGNEVPSNDKAAENKGKKATAPTVVPEKKAKVVRAPRQPSDLDFPSPMESVFSTRTYVITAVVVFGGIGYLMWRNRQRQLELQATTVSQTPFVPAAPPTAPSVDGSRFTADLLAKLDWKRFEELVAAYYIRTGVVATLTKTGPTSLVHIKISWKGEPRPFANVRCIAQPAGPIDVQLLKELMAVLAAEDIRRGYVVTTGDFTPEARVFAEAKQLTLLSGETLIEKLNALPDATRKELRRETVSETTNPA
ncbi:MAG: restriction endonuclease, partial [Opitutaceae bacterium]